MYSCTVLYSCTLSCVKTKVRSTGQRTELRRDADGKFELNYAHTAPCFTTHWILHTFRPDAWRGGTQDMRW